LENFDKHFFGQKKIIALGEMLELGADADGEHARIAEFAAKTKDAQILFVGKYFEAPAKNVNALHFNTSVECKEWLQKNKPASAQILIKGSRGSKMEVLMEAF